MNKILIIATLFIGLHANSEEMDIGNVESLPTVNGSDFKRINEAKEYYEAVLSLIEVQRRVKEEQSGTTGLLNSNNPRNVGSDSSVSNSIPRHLRGKESGDFYIDQDGKKVQREQRPVAYVSTVSGMGSNFTADVIWGDRSISVRKGDTLIGGTFEVITVNKDHVIISGKGQRLKIGMMPVYVDELMSAIQ